MSAKCQKTDIGPISHCHDSARLAKAHEIELSASNLYAHQF